ncbi:MAG: dicarboxylate/amino acid:cation symporter [Peptoniphilaceae bacterium]|uniref:dicarboxylate/amino acid:cation symporter n=1 Tax=Parvimonas sp. TaxID=1944660 RepID=UPI0025FC21EB|nr:dicarboxylate/amino acid:cation symporter [Parvimonas sp.]MCI5997285.1 dicarboxylate/amino acid:cation symporter [Parvimonas sp.]MDD7765441.1 dicarboxylate/amino acid:cation symporter [Peptoniphilaceae bacterium]MDY3050982.1 dicarboxylate/amino acid:cation symporter [Parvimonas sp.]
MKILKKVSLPAQIIIGLCIGVILGLILEGNVETANTYVKPFGTVFLNLIKLVIVPLVFSSLVVGVSELKDIKKLGKIGLKTFLFYTVTTVFAISLGIIFANIFKPGAGFNLPSSLSNVEVKDAPKFIDTLINIFPSNPLKALVEGNMLQIIVFALMLGCGLLAVEDKSKPVFSFFDGISNAMISITNGIMKLAPIGVVGLITPVVATNGPKVLLPLLKVILVVYFVCILHALFTYSISIKFFTKMKVSVFFKKALTPFFVAFTTSSSAGTLPVSMEVAEEELGVSKPIASFVLPLGATINMDGTAIYQGVCALFIAQVYGIDLNLYQQISIVLTTTLASIGTAGVPGAGVIMLAMVLQSVGLPLEGIALIAGVDRIFDMIRTAVNVLGDVTCSVVIAHSEKEIDHSKH